MAELTAVVVGGRPGGADVEAGAVASVEAAPSIGHLTGVARRARGDLLWILGEGASPSPETLPPLLEDPGAPAVSVPVDAAGVPLERLLGRFPEWDVDGILRAVARHRVPLRHTSVVSMVARRDLVASIAPPDERRYGHFAGTEWTWRLFAEERGMLVPQSRVRYDRPDAVGSPLHAVRLARTRVWRRGEALRELHVTVRRGQRA